MWPSNVRTAAVRSFQPQGASPNSSYWCYKLGCHCSIRIVRADGACMSVDRRLSRMYLDGAVAQPESETCDMHTLKARGSQPARGNRPSDLSESFSSASYPCYTYAVKRHCVTLWCRRATSSLVRFDDSVCEVYSSGEVDTPPFHFHCIRNSHRPTCSLVFPLNCVIPKYSSLLDFLVHINAIAGNSTFVSCIPIA